MARTATRRPVRPDGPLRVVGYLRVSTEEQAESGAGLAAQEAAIRAEAERRGWDLVDLCTDAGPSGKSMKGRPSLERALDLCAIGKADALVSAKLDRLSRSALDFAGLMARAGREGWKVVVLDLGVDTTTPAGEMLAGVVAQVAQYERRIIGQRTREGLAAKRAAGVRLGRPPVLPADVVRRIADERAEGRTLRAIAEGLTADAVPTAHGGRWAAGTVAKLVEFAARTAA